MRVGIDLTPLRPIATGVDVYLSELVRALARLDTTTEYVVFANVEDRRRASLPPNYRIVPVCLRSRLTRAAFQQGLLPSLLSWLEVDVLHSPAFLLPLARGRARHVLSVHDATFFTHPALHSPLRRSRAFRRLVRASILRADRIAVASRDTAETLIRTLGASLAARIRVVPLGVSERFRPAAREAALPTLDRLGIRSPYLLHVGTREPRKNLETLVDAYRRLVEAGRVREHLVLAGRPGWGRRRKLARLLASDSLRGRVHLLGYADASVLPALYAGARAFAYPSIEEGFGLPPLEAMACGTPVLVSNRGALRESYGEAALTANPADADALARAIERVLTDAALRRDLVARGLRRAKTFRWDETARATLACYRELAG